MNWRLWLWILVLMPICSSRTSAESSTEERIRAAKKEGAEEARKDLAAGNPKQYRCSGILGPTNRNNWDPNTGLQIVDSGCVCNSAHHDEYNRVVKLWIAEHGLPPASMKPRFVTPEFARNALELATRLRPGKEVVGTQGKMMRWNKPRGGEDASQLVAESKGKVVWSIWLTGPNPIRVAWSDPGSWFVELPPNYSWNPELVWHIDADGNGVLQTFYSTEQQQR